MILISASGLGRQYAGDPVFEGVSFEIRAGDRIGLVGPNGAGKSTLMRLLAGLDRPDYGHLNVRPGVKLVLLKQTPDFAPTETLFDVARSGLADALELQAELEEAARELGEAEDDDDRDRAARRYDEIRDRLEHQDAYSVEHRVEEILGGLGFRSDDYTRAAGTFSGGQQSRMMLAKLLLESPDVMLLDEPSNHLDIDTTAWLENYLARQATAMVIVSHDRYFLDKVVLKIWELHQGKVEAYPGNYTQYWRLRTEKAKLLDRVAERREEEKGDLEAFIRRWGVGQRAKQAKDREKKLARLESVPVETMQSIVGPVMGFGEVERSGDIVLEARELAKSYEKKLFDHFNVTVPRGQCVGVLGPNGAGKSTLIKTLIGQVAPDAGSVRLGHKVRVGYHDQSLDSLPPDVTVLRAVWPEDDVSIVEQDVRNLLARFGLPGDLVHSKVQQLSGGERAKAALARLEAVGANLLVLDEPTNHLDIWSCEALERSIIDFEGTVLVVSHDRYFLNQVADRLVVVADGQARVVEGDYEFYQRLLEQRNAPASKPAAPAPAAKHAPAPSPAPTKNERRKRKYPYKKPADIESEIASKEAEALELEDLLGRPATWREPVKARDLQLRHQSIKDALARLYEHWEEAAEFNA